MTTLTTMRHDDDGFTLVELLVAMGISLVVLFATLQSLDVFTSNAAHQTRVTDANDQVRTTMDRTVRDLRGASRIVLADAKDLMYAVPEVGGMLRTERICVSAIDNDLYSFTTVAAGAPAAPYPACNTGTKLARMKSSPNTGFTYGNPMPATLALVKNVGLTFGLEASGGGKFSTSILRASAARRSATSLPITDDDLNGTCGEGGSGEALLELGLSSALFEEFGPLTVEYDIDGSISVGNGDVPTLVELPPGITKVVARVTNAAGLTSTIERDVECD